MKLSVLVRTAEFRGDHSADVTIAYDVDPSTPIGEVAERVLGRSVHHPDADVMEVRLTSAVPPREEGKP